MKKFFMISCALLMPVMLALSIATTNAMDIPEEPVSLCDMDYDLVSY